MGRDPENSKIANSQIFANVCRFFAENLTIFAIFFLENLPICFCENLSIFFCENLHFCLRKSADFPILRKFVDFFKI